MSSFRDYWRRVCQRSFGKANSTANDLGVAPIKLLIGFLVVCVPCAMAVWFVGETALERALWAGGSLAAGGVIYAAVLGYVVAKTPPIMEAEMTAAHEQALAEIRAAHQKTLDEIKASHEKALGELHGVIAKLSGEVAALQPPDRIQAFLKEHDRLRELASQAEGSVPVCELLRLDFAAYLQALREFVAKERPAELTQIIGIAVEFSQKAPTPNLAGLVPGLLFRIKIHVDRWQREAAKNSS